MIPLTPIIKSLLAEYGIKFCYRLLKRHGPSVIGKVDAKVVQLINDIVDRNKDFEYYCPDCTKEFDLFKKDLNKDKINIYDVCPGCYSQNIHLKNKKTER